jgi:serine/threonine protein kinase
MGLKQGDQLRTAFDTFTVVKQRGAGGSGEVYEVRDMDGHAYAVKVLDSARASSDRLKRFRNEIQFCSRNIHKNIIQVTGSGVTTKEEAFYVMPLYSGTLREIMSHGIPTKEALRLFGQILDGVEAAHLQGIWHRDLKPENVLFSERGNLLVVADFGIAHFEEEELLTAVETKNDERLANFVYSAPEQRVRGRRVDGKADVWALGLILNEMFTGVVPIGTRPRRISDVAPDYAYLDDLVELMLLQEPVERPSIEDVKRELIARGNEFVGLQRLNRLKSEVVPDAEVDDPFIRNPITLVDTDYRDDRLVFILSAVPPPLWIECFQRPNAEHTFYDGARPGSFNFSGKEASVRLGPGSRRRRCATIRIPTSA